MALSSNIYSNSYGYGSTQENKPTVAGLTVSGPVGDVELTTSGIFFKDINGKVLGGIGIKPDGSINFIDKDDIPKGNLIKKRTPKPKKKLSEWLASNVGK